MATAIKPIPPSLLQVAPVQREVTAHKCARPTCPNDVTFGRGRLPLLDRLFRAIRNTKPHWRVRPLTEVELAQHEVCSRDCAARYDSMMLPSQTILQTLQDWAKRLKDVSDREEAQRRERVERKHHEEYLERERKRHEGFNSVFDALAPKEKPAAKSVPAKGEAKPQPAPKAAKPKSDPNAPKKYGDEKKSTPEGESGKRRKKGKAEATQNGKRKGKNRK